MRPLLCLFLSLMPFIMSGQRKQGTIRIDSLKREILYSKADTSRVRLLARLSIQYSGINPDSGLAYGMEGLALARRLEWQKGIALAANSVGVNYQSLSDYSHALKYYGLSLDINQRNQDVKGVSNNLGNIGLVYCGRGDYPKALEYFFRSLKINEKLERKAEIANNLSNIGSVYFRQGDLELARKYYRQAIMIDIQLRDSMGIARTTGVLGDIHLRENELDKALEFYNTALGISSRMGDKYTIGCNYKNIGSVYRSRKDYNTALSYYFKALEIHKAIGERREYAIDLGFVGICYLEMCKAGETKNISLAVKHLRQAVEIFNEVGSIDRAGRFSRRLSDAYALAGDYKQALAAYQQFEHLEDSVFSQANKVAIARLENQREIEVRDHDIQIKDKQIEIARLKAVEARDEKIILVLFVILLVTGIVLLLQYIRKQRRLNRKLTRQAEEHFENIQSMRALLDEIASYQSHNVRGAVASILGLAQFFNYDDISDPMNIEIINGIAASTEKLDKAVHAIVDKANDG